MQLTAAQAKVKGASRRRLIEQLWADGLTAREIGEQLGWAPSTIAAGVSHLRALGYDLPRRRGPAGVDGRTR